MLCLLHCLLLPIIVALLPALAGVLRLPEALHFVLFAVAVPISSLAIISGYRRHGALLPGAIAAFGLVFLGIGALAGFPLLLETSVTVAGSLALAFGHVFNWRSGALQRGRQPTST